jgi:thioredoxin 1
MAITAFGSTIKALGQESWEKTIKETKGLLVVNFWGAKCSDCEVFMPVFESVAAELGDKAKFATVECYQDLSHPLGCGVRGAPTVIIYKDGKECERKMGSETKERLVARIKNCMSDTAELKDWKM